MAFSDIVSVMPPATWYEIPNTKMSSVYAITDPGDSRYGSEGPSSIVYDWCGAAFDTDHNKFIITGGGHTNYGGNEVYEFPLDTLTWACVTTPSTYTQDPAFGTDGLHFLTTDGNPVSSHTYDSLQYIPGIGKMFRYGGATWKSGNAANQVYLFDTSAYTWEAKSTNDAVLETATAYDAGRNRIYVVKHQELAAYDIATDTWTTLVGSSWPTFGDLTAEYDPVHDQLLVVSGTGVTGFWVYDVAAGGVPTQVTLTGDTDVSNFRIGLAWDSTRSLYTLWNGNRDVWTIDPTTWVSTKVSATTGSAPVFPAQCDGVYSKWQYVPDYDVFLGYTSGEGNVWVYKPGIAGSGPAPGWGDPQRVVPITLGAGVVSGSHTGFRALITRANLPDEMLDPSGLLAAQVNGGDVRITADLAGTIRLPLHCLKFAHDSATGAKDAPVEIWAKLPSLDSSTTVYVWYHSATTQVQPAASDAYGRNAVYDGLIAGWHIDNIGTVADITGGGGDITITSSGGTVSGPYADTALSINFNTTAVTPSLPLDQDYTFTFLIKHSVNLAANVAATLNGSADAAAAFALRGNTANTLIFRLQDDAGATNDIATGVSFAQNAWSLYSLASPVGLGDQKVYAGGALVSTTNTTRRAGAGSASFRGSGATIYWAKAFIAKGILSADWLTTQANNLNSPGMFFVAGTPQTPVIGGAIAESAQASDAYAVQALAMAAWNDAVQAADGFAPVARVAAAITESVLASESDGEISQALALFTGPASGNALVDALGQVSAALAAGTAAGEAWTVQANALAELVAASAAGDVLSASATQALQAAVSEPTQASAAFVAAIAAIAQITAPASASAQFDATSAAAPRGAIVESAAAADALIATVSVLVTLGAGAGAHDTWSGAVAALDTQLNEMASAAARLDAQIAIHASMQASGYAGDTWLGALAQITGVFTSLVRADSIIAARAAIVAVLTNRVIAGSMFDARLPGNGYLIAGAITLTAALSGTITLTPN